MTPPRLTPRQCFFVGSSRKDLVALPEEVRRHFGHALHLAQCGEEPPDAKALKGFRGRSVLEVVEDLATDTFRAVYTVRFAEAVYVLHAFQKKSNNGAETPKHEIDLIKQRLRDAEQHYRQHFDKGGR